MQKFVLTNLRRCDISGVKQQIESQSKFAQFAAEMEMGQRVMGHGSNGSPFLDGSRGSRVTARTH